MSNRGFVNISLIAWFPFIAVLLFSAFWLIWFLQQKMVMANLCQQYTLKSQEILVDRNNKIMNLNSRAWWLWGEKKALDIAILTGPPPVKAAAKIRRKMVVAEQKSLRGIQKGFFNSANFQSRRALYQLRSQFRRQTKKWQDFWGSNRRIRSSLQVFPKQSQLAVRIHDIAPVFKRRNQHSRQQSIKATWRIPLADMLPSWLKEKVPVHRHWTGACYSHPHLGGLQWRAAIGKGNH